MLALTCIIERFIVFTKARINVNEFLTKIRKALLVNRNVKEAIKDALLAQWEQKLLKEGIAVELPLEDDDDQTH